MKFLKGKRFQIGALLLLLLVIIAGGIWWFARLSGTAGTTGKDNFNDAAMEMAEGVELAGRHFTYYETAKDGKQDVAPFCLYTQGELFSYENQVCYLSFEDNGEDFSVSLVSADSGDTLRAWPMDSFYREYPPTLLRVDAGNTLWALYKDYTGEENWILYNTEEKKAVEIAAETVSSFMESGLYSFNVWNGHMVLFSGSKLAMLDFETGEMREVYGNVGNYYLDRNGNLYYLLETPDTLVKYSLENDRQLWAVNDLPSIGTAAITVTDRGELFLLGSSRDTFYEVFAIDPETGKTSWELTTLSRDLTDVPDGWPLNAVVGFAIGENYQIYLSEMDWDLSAENEEDRWSWRHLYILDPLEKEVEPADAIELTITAPYVIDSVDTAARIYQRDHPEVRFLWDTQYLSSEEFVNNVQEYKDQFALRAMAGGLGDIVMVNGFGLDARIVTDTDAFADLSAYLEACPFKDELSWSQVEPLQGKDGTIRALPLGAIPTYYVWNEELLDELGIDPDSVTWSELLAMALQWKEDGTDLSLAVSDDSSFGFETMLTDILLANLYAAEQADGTVQLDQPYLRELMENLKELMGSKHLIRGVPRSIFSGNEKALFVVGETNRSIADRISDLESIVENGAMTPCAAALPKGEVNKKQQGYAFCWGLSNRSEKLDAAWDFLQFLISGEGFPDGLYSERCLSLNKTAQETWANSHSIEWIHRNFEDGGWKYFHQLQASLDIPCSAYEEPYGWYDAVCEPMLRYFDDELTLDEAMTEANANWERLVTE